MWFHPADSQAFASERKLGLRILTQLDALMTCSSDVSTVVTPLRLPRSYYRVLPWRRQPESGFQRLSILDQCGPFLSVNRGVGCVKRCEKRNVQCWLKMSPSSRATAPTTFLSIVFLLLSSAEETKNELCQGQQKYHNAAIKNLKDKLHSCTGRPSWLSHQAKGNHWQAERHGDKKKHELNKSE